MNKFLLLNEKIYIYDTSNNTINFDCSKNLNDKFAEIKIKHVSYIENLFVILSTNNIIYVIVLFENDTNIKFQIKEYNIGETSKATYIFYTINTCVLIEKENGYFDLLELEKDSTVNSNRINIVYNKNILYNKNTFGIYECYYFLIIHDNDGIWFFGDISSYMSFSLRIRMNLDGDKRLLLDVNHINNYYFTNLNIDNDILSNIHKIYNGHCCFFIQTSNNKLYCMGNNTNNKLYCSIYVNNNIILTLSSITFDDNETIINLISEKCYTLILTNMGNIYKYGDIHDSYNHSYGNNKMIMKKFTNPGIIHMWKSFDDTWVYSVDGFLKLFNGDKIIITDSNNIFNTPLNIPWSPTNHIYCKSETKFSIFYFYLVLKYYKNKIKIPRFVIYYIVNYITKTKIPYDALYII